MNYLHGQILARSAQFLRAFAEAVTGAYKLHSTETGDGKGGWRPLTDEEKLKSIISQMRAHIDRLNECLEHLPQMRPEGV